MNKSLLNILVLLILVSLYEQSSGNPILSNQDEWDQSMEKIQFQIKQQKFTQADDELNKLIPELPFQSYSQIMAWVFNKEELHYRLDRFFSCYELLNHAEAFSKMNGKVNYLALIYRELAKNFFSLNNLNLSNLYLDKSIHFLNYSKDTAIYLKIANLLISLKDAKRIERIPPFTNCILCATDYVIQTAESDLSRYYWHYMTASFNKALMLMEYKKWEEALRQFSIVKRNSSFRKDSTTMCNAYSCCGEIYLIQEKIDSAYREFELSNIIGLRLNDIYVLHKNATFLARIEKGKKNIEKALKYTELKDSLSQLLFHRMNLQGMNVSTHLRLIKNAKQQLINLENLSIQIKAKEELKSIVVVVLSVSILLLLILVYFIFKFFREKNRLQKMEQKEKLQRIQSEQEKREVIAREEGHRDAREFLSNELHDLVANSIAAIKLKSIHLAKQTNHPSFHTILQNLDALYHKVRNLSHTLYTPDIENNSLENLLRQFIFDFENANQIHVYFSFDDETAETKINSTMKELVYSIILELFINIYKYSECTEVNLTISIIENELLLILTDNGIGFDTNNFTGRGLQNIKKKLSQFNGRIEVYSQINKGTTYQINILTNEF